MGKHLPAPADDPQDTVRARLDAAVGDGRTPTGTPLAGALHHLFLSEARQQGTDAAERAWMALGASGIGEIAAELLACLWGSRRLTYVLPAGTEMIPVATGWALVGGETAGFDVDRPGVHAVEDLPVAPGGSNLAQLLRLIDELGRGIPSVRPGTPAIVERYEGDHPSHRLQFPPFAAAGGVVLQRSMDLVAVGEYLCAYTEEMVHDLATATVADLRALSIDHAAIAERARRARDAAERRAAGLDGVAVHAVTADYRERRGHHHFVMAVEFEAWDHALRRGIVVQDIGPDGEPDPDGPVRLDLADEVSRLRSLGADGRIEGLAHAIVEAAPQGPRAVLRELGERFEADVALPLEVGTQEFRLHWRDGAIRASSPGMRPVCISMGHVTLWGRTIPETIAVALRGRPLHRLFDQPFRCDAPIASARCEGDRIELDVEPDLRLVDCAGGRMWREGGPPAGNGPESGDVGSGAD